MTTGDLKNNLRKLQRQLKLVAYSHDVDLEGLSSGSPSAYLPIYHYVFLEYSQPLGALLLDLKQDLYGKADLKFVEAMYRVLREVFAYKPPISKGQFFAAGFAECKVIMCTQILTLVETKHASLTGRKSTSLSRTSQAATKKPLTVVNNLPPVAGNIPGAFGRQVIVMQECPAAARKVDKSGAESQESSVRWKPVESRGAAGGSGSVDKHAIQVSVTRERLPHGSKDSNPVCRSGEPAMEPSTAGCTSELLEPSRAAMMKRGSVTVVKETTPCEERGRGSVPDDSGNRVSQDSGSDVPGSRVSQESGSDDFVLSLLSSISQTMIQLIARVDEMNGRVCRLESMYSTREVSKEESSDVSCLNDFAVQSERNRSRSSLPSDEISCRDLNGKDLDFCPNRLKEKSYHKDEAISSSVKSSSSRCTFGTVNRSVEDLSDDEHDQYSERCVDRSRLGERGVKCDSGDESSLMQSLNNITARLTLLENNITILNSSKNKDADVSIGSIASRDSDSIRSVTFSDNGVKSAAYDSGRYTVPLDDRSKYARIDGSSRLHSPDSTSFNQQTTTHEKSTMHLHSPLANRRLVSPSLSTPNSSPACISTPDSLHGSSVRGQRAGEHSLSPLVSSYYTSEHKPSLPHSAIGQHSLLPLVSSYYASGHDSCPPHSAIGQHTSLKSTEGHLDSPASTVDHSCWEQADRIANMLQSTQQMLEEKTKRTVSSSS